MSIMSPDDHERQDLAGLAGLYALDALEGEDLARFEQFLRTNPDVQDEVAGYRAAAAQLAAVSASAPPPALRERVLAGAATTRQDAPVVRLGGRRGGGAPARRLLLAAAAALVVLVAALGGYQLGSGKDVPVARRADDLAALLSRPDTAVVPLNGIEDDRPTGRVVLAPGSDVMVVVSDDMARTRPGRTYEMWKVTSGGGVVSAGTFEPDADGRVEARLPVDLDGATTFLVTDEPDGGSEAPTTEPIMQATVE